jgi:thiamine-phosphate diphosphorylase
MLPNKQCLRFYFITDDGPVSSTPVEQVRAVLAAGATMVQYRNKRFGLHFYQEAEAIQTLCRQSRVPFIINDNVLLAKALGADGVHVGQDDEPVRLARQVLGPLAIIGMSVSTLEELSHTPLDGCDYIGTGPVFATQTKKDAKSVRTLEGLKAVTDQSPLPVVAIGGITPATARQCLDQGAAGVAVISAITRAENPEQAAQQMAAACGIR